MQREKRDEKKEEIMVLDKGKNMDDDIMVAFCCGALIIPLL